MKKWLKVIINSLLISAIGVFVIDYFSHLFFSSPMETTAYFFGKAAVYFVFSMIFLDFVSLEKKEFLKVLIAGIIVSLLWGIYYNVLPSLTGIYPVGISLAGISFLGMGIFGTGLAFGIVHTIAFVGGYYASRMILGRIR